MIVYRITRPSHLELDGEGARRSGGRWNSPGTPLVYASATRALAALEYLIHIDIDDVPDDVVLLSIVLPDEPSIEEVVDDEAGSAGGRSERTAGDAWAESRRTLVLGVPSRVVPEERNYLLNPRHASAGELRVAHVRPFAYDERLTALR